MHDYLIVGHGTAGALLSHQLIKKGQKVFVLDAPKDNSASKVAAGLFNPITGRKMRKTWMANQFFPLLSDYYKDMEKTLNASFYNEIGIYRPFFSIEQQNDCNARMADDMFVNNVSNQPDKSRKFNDDFGGLHLNNAGYVNIKVLLEAHKNFLLDKGCYREGVLNESQLKLEDGKVMYDGMTFKGLIFCVGIGQQNFPYFDWLPFRPVKGEIYEFKMELDSIVNRGVFMLPKGEGVCRVGATYNWKEVDEQTTEAGKKELIEKMEALYSGKHEIIGGKAGIRPATKDRRPFIGKHPKHEQLHVFNGFGSKGVSMIPYFSKMFADCLITGQSVEKEVNINRYFSLHYKE